jgi:hypothetical protein
MARPVLALASPFISLRQNTGSASQQRGAIAIEHRYRSARAGGAQRNVRLSLAGSAAERSQLHDACAL